MQKLPAYFELDLALLYTDEIILILWIFLYEICFIKHTLLLNL